MKEVRILTLIRRAGLEAADSVWYSVCSGWLLFGCGVLRLMK